jgi:hypothetical protein
MIARVQSFEAGRDHEVQSVLSRIGLPEHRDQDVGHGGAAFRRFLGSECNNVSGLLRIVGTAAARFRLTMGGGFG